MSRQTNKLNTKPKTKRDRHSTPTKDMEVTKDLYSRVTDVICEALEKGVVPWRKPWKARKGGWRPVNFKTKVPYRGINVLLLGLSPYAGRFWLTYNQAVELGGQVKKGERGTLAIRYGLYEKTSNETDQDGEEIKLKSAFLKSFFLFNLDQIEGIEDPESIEQGDLKDVDSLEECEKIIKGYKGIPELAHGGDRAFYRPSTDLVTMPDKWRFENSEEYYSTFFHELAHSTGHEKRLNREGLNPPHKFGDVIYSKEELIAEMSASFLCANAGIDQATLSNSAAYIGSWVEVLRGNNRLVISAAAQAQKAVDHILGEGVGESEEPAKETVGAL
jgi:antirestriction protein ArdC